MSEVEVFLRSFENKIAQMEYQLERLNRLVQQSVAISKPLPYIIDTTDRSTFSQQKVSIITDVP
jgi:hypothetical protein